MQVDIGKLATAVAVLFIYMIPGYILKKTKLADDGFTKALSLVALYVAQVALLIYGFVRDFDQAIFIRICWVFGFSVLAHSMFYGLSFLFFCKAPLARQRVLRYGIVFSNAGYMGIPVIESAFGSEYAIYATVYIVAFNLFAFSVGRLMFTGDRKYISVKKMLVNPAVIPICIGLLFFFLPINQYVPALVMDVLSGLKNMVAPIAMMVIGARLADIDLKGIWKDRYALPFLGIRLFLFPVLLWGVMKLCMLAGFFTDTVAMAILLVLSSTPAAAFTTIFAEMYDGDAPYASKLVALSTLCTIFTMPLVALLLRI